MIDERALPRADHRPRPEPLTTGRPCGMPCGMPELEPHFEKIAFPTDRITIGDLRRVYASEIAEDAKTWNKQFASSRLLTGRAGTDMGSTLADERALANKAFLAALGRPDNPVEDREEMIRSLARDYVRFGLASGLEHTRQLVRTFEAAAAAQAQALLGGAAGFVSGFAPRRLVH